MSAIKMIRGALANVPLLTLFVISVSMSVMLKWLSLREPGYTFSIVQGTQIVSLVIMSSLQTIIVAAICCCVARDHPYRGDGSGEGSSMTYPVTDPLANAKWMGDDVEGDSCCPPTIRMNGSRSRKWRNRIVHTFVVGFLLGSGGMMLYFGAKDKDVSGPMVVLIQQATVPFTLIASMVLLGDRYKVGHFLGCVMVTIGVLATVWPMFRATDYSENVIWSVASLLGSVSCHAIASMYLDRTLLSRKEDGKRTDDDRPNEDIQGDDDDEEEGEYRTPTWTARDSIRSEGDEKRMGLLSMWIAIGVMEIIISTLMMLPTAALEGMDPRTLFERLWEGYECIIMLDGEADPSAICDPSVTIVFFMHGLMLSFLRINLSIVIHRSNVVMMWIVMSCTVPASMICFSMDFIMGKDVVPFDPYIILGTALVVLGTIFFRAMGDPMKGALLSEIRHRCWSCTCRRITG